MTRVWLLALLAFVACTGRLCGESYLAELESHSGEVQRDQASAVGAWGKVRSGDRFQIGDGLRTGRSGSARLSLAADGTALIEASTLVRFLDRDPRGAGRRMSVEDGAVRIESGTLDLDVDTPRALARIDKGARVRIIAAGSDVKLDVEVGRVAIEADGQISELLGGQQITIGKAQPLPPKEADAAPPPADQPSDAGVRTPAGGLHLTLERLESTTLHAPTLPLLLQLPTPACPTRVALEVNGRPAPKVSEREDLLRIASGGAHRVRLRCGRAVVADAVLRVQRDLATMELPKSAQRVEVDADGRRYTVRYQNVLPVVGVRWRDAPESPAYALVLKRGARERRFESAAPKRDLQAAELSEGEYQFWFTGSSGRKSASSSLRIEFDNTARALSLSQPTEGSAAEGDEVAVSGVALLRSEVSANGVPLPLDAKGRFSARVPLSRERSLLVRASHPSAGVHYYLRHLR